MYRIISGKSKGRRIKAPDNFEVRPTTDYAKEGLFNILGNQYNFSEDYILDLFAGIGSISLEFCSRGAQSVIAVDNNYKHCKFIEKTRDELGYENELEVVKSNVFEYLKNTSQTFDLIFADPPYDLREEQYENLHQLIFERELLNENGVFILEHSSKAKFEELPYFQSSRKYGNVSFSFFEKG